MRFCSAAKDYDGLVADARVFEAMVLCDGMKMRSALDVTPLVISCLPFRAGAGAEQRSLAGTLATLRAVSARFDDLLLRLKTPRFIADAVDPDVVSSRLALTVAPSKRVTSVPLLPYGGGSCLKVPIASTEGIESLATMVSDAILMLEIAALPNSKQVFSDTLKL